jgi:hypothetical protein
VNIVRTMGSVKRVWHWWRRHPWFALLMLLVLALGARLLWGWSASRMLEEKLADLRQLGEPVQPADFVYERVPPAENAWPLLLQAEAALAPGVDSPSTSNLDYPQFPPFGADWMKLAEASEKAHGNAMALTRQARQRSRVQIRTTFPANPGFANPLRELPQIVADGALYAHFHGDDVEAMERLLDVLHIARSMRHDDFITTHLMAMGQDAMVCNRAQTIAPGLKPQDLRGKTELSARVRQLIRELLDEERIRPQYQLSLRSERMIYINHYRLRAGKTWVIRPLAELDTARMLEEIDISIKGAAARTWPEAQRIIAAIERDPRDQGRDDIPRYSRWFSSPAWFSGVTERMFRGLAERRTTAVVLAAHLYRADQGRFPNRLEDLVPNYLPSIPADPFAADGRPLGYVINKMSLPNGQDRPLIFFDPGGPDILPDYPTYGWYTTPLRNRPPPRAKQPIRQYRDLTLFVPASPTKTVDGDPEQPDAPGDDSK